MNTAMTELIEKLEEEIGNINHFVPLSPYLEKEKQQIVDAVVWFDDTGRRPHEIEKEVIDYYNETYNQ